MAEVIALAVGIFGIAGVLFTALSWRRNDTASLVSQQDTLFNELNGMNDRLRTERDDARTEVVRLNELLHAR